MSATLLLVRDPSRNPYLIGSPPRIAAPAVVLQVLGEPTVRMDRP